MRSNRISNSTFNFWIDDGFNNDIDDSNTVEGKPIIYWGNVQNKVAPVDAGYVAFVNCTNVTAQGLDLSHNGQGILVAFTTNAKVTQNTLSKCDSGIYLFNSTSTKLAENSVSNNANGIRGESASANFVTSNTVSGNKIGVYFTGNSANNTITKNNITTNSEDVVNCWGSKAPLSRKTA